MSFVLHLHPLSSFCQKVLMALYETGTPFEPRMVDLGDAQARAAYLKLSPFGKIPTLEDTARGRAVNESTIIIEYLQQQHPGRRHAEPGNQWTCHRHRFLSETRERQRAAETRSLL